VERWPTLGEAGKLQVVAPTSPLSPGVMLAARRELSPIDLDLPLCTRNFGLAAVARALAFEELIQRAWFSRKAFWALKQR